MALNQERESRVVKKDPRWRVLGYLLGTSSGESIMRLESMASMVATSQPPILNDIHIFLDCFFRHKVGFSADPLHRSVYLEARNKFAHACVSATALVKTPPLDVANG